MDSGGIFRRSNRDCKLEVVGTRLDQPTLDLEAVYPLTSIRLFEKGLAGFVIVCCGQEHEFYKAIGSMHSPVLYRMSSNPALRAGAEPATACGKHAADSIYGKVRRAELSYSKTIRQVSQPYCSSCITRTTAD